MAFSVYIQSQIAKEWQNYINDAKKYLKKIKEIANKKTISKKDKQRVKIMLEIIIEEYKTLKHSPLLPKKLKQTATQLYIEGKKLYEKVFANRSS